MKVDCVEVLDQLKNKLFQNEPIKLALTKECFELFEDKPGVYLILDKDELIYVGESGNVKKRMKDIRNTQNHTIRRLLGESLYSNHENYWKATSRLKFHPDIEKKLGEYIKENIYVKSIATIIGRKELEELIMSHNSELLNKRRKRV